MLKQFTAYTSERQFLEAVDSEIDMILRDRSYDTTEEYIADIQKVWVNLSSFCDGKGYNLTAVQTDEDTTGNARMSSILQLLENRLQSE